jgi:hypothetical protein
MRLRVSDDFGTTELAEAERRLQEISALIDGQRQIVEEAKQRGYDATSAKTVFESLQVSLSFCAQVWDRLENMLREQAA